MAADNDESLGLPSRAQSQSFESFCPTPMAATLNGIIQQRQPGTNHWVFEDTYVSAWINGNTDRGCTVPGQAEREITITKLWLYGFPGCGRTVATASIIEHLIRDATPKHSIGYYFCRMQDRETGDPRNILRTLISQLAQQNEDVSKLLNSYLASLPRQGSESSGPNGKGSLDCVSIDHLRELLHSICRCSERVSLVINSFENVWPDDRSSLSRLLASLVDSPGSTLRVMITSDYGSGMQPIAGEMRACPVYVYGRAEDIRLYVQVEISKRISRGATFLELEPVRAGVENYIVDNCNGAWLWALCELDNQCHLASRGPWRPPRSTAHTQHDASADGSLGYGPDPGNLVATIYPYDTYLARVLREGGPRKIYILRRVLTWIYVGTLVREFRLSVSETCNLLSILLRHHEIEEAGTQENEVDQDEVLEIGGQLIRKSPDGKIFEFRHDTVEVYLHKCVGKEDNNSWQFRLGEVSVDVFDELDIVMEHLATRGQTAEAEDMMLRVIRCREMMWGPIGNAVLHGFTNLGRFYCEHGRSDEGEKLLRRAVEGYEKSNAPYKPSMYAAMHNLGLECKRRGEFREAQMLYKKALAGNEELFGPESGKNLDILYCLGRLYAAEDRLDEAVPLWERYFRGCEKVYGHHDTTTITAAFDLGKLYHNIENIDEAIPLTERAVDGYKQTQGAHGTKTLIAMDHLGELYATQGRDEEAETVWKRAEEGLDLNLGPVHKDSVGTKRNLARLYSSQGRLIEASDMYEKVLQGYQTIYNPDDIMTAEIYGILAHLYYNLDRLHDSEGMASEALRIHDESLSPVSMKSVENADLLGLLYAKQDRPHKALPLWQRSLQGHEEIKGPDHLLTIGTIHNLGRIYKMLFHMEDAETMLERGFERAVRALGVDHSLTQRMGADLALLYENLAKPAKAEDVVRRL